MSLYLSRFYLSEQHRQAVRDAYNPYSLHQTLRWAFEGAGEDNTPLPEGERLLWRDDGRRGFLLQSHSRPDWDALSGRWGEHYFAKTPIVKPFDPTVIGQGERLIFRLRANVTVSRHGEGSRESGKRGKLTGLHGADNQVAWLRRHGERGGFAVLSTDISSSGKLHFYKPQGRVMTFYEVTFDGMLEVTDKSAFMETVTSGIGRAKAVGFGLLSLARS